MVHLSIVFGTDNCQRLCSLCVSNLRFDKTVTSLDPSMGTIYNRQLFLSYT